MFFELADVYLQGRNIKESHTNCVPLLFVREYVFGLVAGIIVLECASGDHFGNVPVDTLVLKRGFLLLSLHFFQSCV